MRNMHYGGATKSSEHTPREINYLSVFLGAVISCVVIACVDKFCSSKEPHSQLYLPPLSQGTILPEEFRQADTNGDGRLGRSELLKLVRENPALLNR